MNLPEAFTQASATLDTSGLLCPEPLLLCRKALMDLPIGAMVHIIATDPHAELDFAVFSKRTGHSILHQIWQGEHLHLLIEKT